MSQDVSRSEVTRRIMDGGIVAVIRTDSPEPIPQIAEALIAGGVRSLEITLTVPNAVQAIRDLVARFGGEALVGAGTVLSVEACQAVLDAGARFVVSPVARVELVPVAHRSGAAVMLGAFTPTEAQSVHESGADFVKLFPCDTLGAGYVKSLLAPLPHLRIIPTGGVDLKTAPELIKAGCVAVGAGSTLVSKELINSSRWSDLTALASEFRSQVDAARRPGR